MNTEVVFDSIIDDDYEQIVDVSIGGRDLGHLYKDMTDDSDYAISDRLEYELETLRGKTWRRLEDAKRDVIAAAADPRNRPARLANAV